MLGKVGRTDPQCLLFPVKARTLDEV